MDDSTPRNHRDSRPFSDNLVDLHISVVPPEHWVERLNYASHKVISDTFSVGFIRILPETTVAKLRSVISAQIGEDIFPQDYVFLKHVGRCLALVRQKQEAELKVKSFMPPHSSAPEIYVLPKRPAMYGYSVLPPIQPGRASQLRTPSDHLPMPPAATPTTTAGDHSHRPKRTASDDQWSSSTPAKLPARSSQKSASSKNEEPTTTRATPNSHTSHLRTPVVAVTHPPARHVSGQSSVHNEHRHEKTVTQFLYGGGKPSPATKDRYGIPAQHRPGHVPSPADMGKMGEEQIRKSTHHDIPEKMQQVQYTMPSPTASRTSSDDAARVESANDDSGFVDRDRSDSDDDALPDNERFDKPPRSQDTRRETRYSHRSEKEMLPSSSPPPHSPTTEHSPEDDALSDEPRREDDGDDEIASSPVVSETTEEITETKQFIKSPPPLNREAPVVLSPHADSSKAAAAVEEKRQQVKAQQALKQQQEQKKQKDRVDKAALWERLLEARATRQRAEQARADMVKFAKTTSQKMNQKRASVRDAWKRKFFEEKKKTLPLEDTCQRLRNEHERSHQRLVSGMEANATGANRAGVKPFAAPTSLPSLKNNSKIQAARLQHEIEALRRKIEGAKIKLTGEIKLRHQAEQDVKTLRQELLSKKIRAHLAFRQLSRANPQQKPHANPSLNIRSRA